jgi:hypothetical protein
MTDVAHNAVLTSVAASTSSTPLLGANLARRGCLVTNDASGGSILYLAYAPTASTSAYTAQVASGTTWVMQEPIFTGAISGIWSASGTGGAKITEL